MQPVQGNNQPTLTSSSIELLYPVLAIDRSNVCRPSDSAPDLDMASPSDDHSYDAGSSLSESAYEVLGDSTVLTSDDEDRDDTTDSLISVGINTPADVSSLSGTDDGEDDVSAHNQVELEESNPEVAQGSGRLEEVTRSDVTIRTGPNPMSTELEFEESPYGRIDAQGECTLRTYSMQESLRILRDLRIEVPPVQIAAALQLKMADTGLVVEGPFQVLYVGNPSAKRQIIAKLASSLAAGSPNNQRGSSRFSVAPSSAYLDVGVELIESLGIELVVDECTCAKTAEYYGAPGTLSLLINGDFECHSKPCNQGFIYEGRGSWRLPHLTVFFVSNDDDVSARQTRQYAREFMTRHAVATMVISESALYERLVEDVCWYDSSSLHACLVTRKRDLDHPEGSDHSHVLRRLPIDLDTFLKVNTQQLSRNLALITRDSFNRREGRQLARIPDTGASSEDILKSSQGKAARADGTHPFRRRAGQDWRALAFLAVMIMLVLASTSSTILFHKFGKSWLAEKDPGYQGPVGSLLDSSRAAPLTGTRKSSPAMAVTADAPGSKSEKRLPMEKTTNTKSLAVLNSKDLARMLTEQSIMVVNQSDDFKTQMVGDCHIILRLPKKLAVLRKTPVLVVKVVRQGQVVDAEASKLFEGVYALRFQREDAWGVMDVTVSTTSKPFVEQTFQVDCGTPWLKIREWRKVAHDISNQLQTNFRRAQGGLEKSLAQVHTGIQTAFGQAIQWRAQIGGLRAGHWQIPFIQELGRKSKQLSVEMEAQRKALLKGISDHANAVSCMISRRTAKLNRAWGNFHQVWKPVDEFRTVASKTLTVARARKQASRVWSRMASQMASRKTARASRKGVKRTSRRECNQGRRSCQKLRR